MTFRYKLYTHDNSFIEETDAIPLNFTGIATYISGSKHWFVDGKKHRVGGPASEYADGSKDWYNHGNLHRLDGPAVEYTDDSKCWFIDGKEITELEHKLLIDIMKLKGLL